jgi:hypothetical protein
MGVTERPLKPRLTAIHPYELNKTLYLSPI